MELSEIFVTIRGDAQKLDGDMRQAHGAARSVGDRIQNQFTHHLYRGLGVFALLRAGATSLGSGLRQIEDQNIISPESGRESLEALLRIREENRNILETIPLLGEVGGALMRGFSDDSAIKRTIKDLETIKGGQEAFERARAARESATVKAARAAGLPEPQVKAIAAELEDRQLADQEQALRAKAAEAKRVEEAAFEKARTARRDPYAQRMIEGGGLWLYGRFRANKALNEAEAQEAAAAEAMRQRIGFERAAREVQQQRKLMKLANNPVEGVSGNALPAEAVAEQESIGPMAEGRAALANELAQLPSSREIARRAQPVGRPSLEIPPDLRIPTGPIEDASQFAERYREPMPWEGTQVQSTMPQRAGAAVVADAAAILGKLDEVITAINGQSDRPLMLRR